MADEKSNPSTARPHRSRKRPPPTIDLPAKEIKAQEPPAGDGSPPPETEPVAAPSASGAFIKYAGIGASVAAGVVATLAVLWFASHLPTGGNASALRDRLAALEAEVTAKASTPQADPQALTNLSQRLDKLEQAVGKLPAASRSDAAPDQRLTAIEKSMKSLDARLTVLTKRADDIAATSAAAHDRADAAFKAAEAVQSRVEGLERAAKATQDKVAEHSGADASARRALAAFALREAVVSGGPYSAELTSAKNTGLDGSKVNALEPFANAGIPTNAMLVREMSALLPKLEQAADGDIPQNTGFMERLQTNAGKLVRIHPVGDPSGDDASAVLARIRTKAAHNDAGGIVSELPKLPPKARALTNDWSKKLAARDSALAAAHDLARDAVAAH
jgi:hypothetical protein